MGLQQSKKSNEIIQQTDVELNFADQIKSMQFPKSYKKLSIFQKTWEELFFPLPKDSCSLIATMSNLIEISIKLTFHTGSHSTIMLLGEAISHLTNLTNLSLALNNAYFQGIDNIWYHMYLENLEVYWIKEWNAIDDKTFYMLMGSISRVPALKNLTLNLSSNTITVSGFLSIKPLIKNMINLQEISLNFENQLKLIREKNKDYVEFSSMGHWFTRIALQEAEINEIFIGKKIKALIL